MRILKIIKQLKKGKITISLKKGKRPNKLKLEPKRRLQPQLTKQRQERSLSELPGVGNQKHKNNKIRIMKGKLTRIKLKQPKNQINQVPIDIDDEPPNNYSL